MVYENPKYNINRFELQGSGGIYDNVVIFDLVVFLGGVYFRGGNYSYSVSGSGSSSGSSSGSGSSPVIGILFPSLSILYPS